MVIVATGSTQRTPQVKGADSVEMLSAADILEGHLSTSLPHLANISYRVGRSLRFDGVNEKFVNDRDADALLTRAYRAPYIVPATV